MDKRPAYESVRGEQRQELRELLLRAAADLFSSAGPGGVSLRAVSRSVGASTTVVYSHFGSKAGLVLALYDHGFGMLKDRIATATTTVVDAPSGVRQAAQEYRRFAIENPHFYELMYGPQIRHLLPTPDDRTAARPIQELLTSVFRQGQETGEFSSSDPSDQARDLWAVMHGVVSLELTTWFDADEGAARFEHAVETRLQVCSQPLR